MAVFGKSKATTTTYNVTTRRTNHRRKLKRTVVFGLVLGFGLCWALLYAKLVSRLEDIVVVTPQQQLQQQLQTRQQLQKVVAAAPNEETTTTTTADCAILLFGLPRAFREFVLPSLETNVILPNAKYDCDYFVHYFDQANEESGRSGKGGSIRVEDIYLLKDSVQRLHHPNNNNNKTSIVDFVSDTNETFWNRRSEIIEKYRNSKTRNGKPLYFPYKESTYEFPGTLDNIVRQWHSIHAAWDAMKGARSTKRYRRVAMMRNDVVYITPIDIFGTPAANETTTTTSTSNADNSHSHSDSVAVIPNFAKWPINDRMICGPYEAVEIWATQRWSLLEEYAKDRRHAGMVMHSETFLKESVLATIRKRTSTRVVEDPGICFLRVRADGAIWIEDCDPSKSGFGGGYPGGMDAYTPLLQKFLPRACKIRKLVDIRIILELACEEEEGENNNNNNNNNTNTNNNNNNNKLAS